VVEALVASRGARRIAEELCLVRAIEKVHAGSSATDLAHAALATSTLWHPDAGNALSPDDVQRFHP
jgi:hypothetical protein